MKKYLLTALFAILLFSCEGPTGAQGEPGYSTNWAIVPITIKPHEWQRIGGANELNSYFQVDKQVGALTNFVYTDGAVIPYILTDDNVKNILPYVLHKGTVINQKEYLWTETYDFDFYPGGVGFYLTYSDFSTDIRPEIDITFYVVLMW